MCFEKNLENLDQFGEFLPGPFSGPEGEAWPDDCCSTLLGLLDLRSLREAKPLKIEGSADSVSTW